MSQYSNLQTRSPAAANRLPAPSKRSALSLIDPRQKKFSDELSHAVELRDELFMRIVGNAVPDPQLHVDSGIFKNVNRSLATSDLPLSWLLENARIVAWKAEARSGHFTYVSKQAKAMLGYPLRDWYKPDFLSLHLHPEDRRRVLARYRSPFRQGGHYNLTFRMIAKDGHVVWMRNLISTSLQEGEPESLYGLMLDISEQRQAEIALVDLGGRLITSQELQSAHIARELHDDFNQRLALLSIELEQLGDATPELLDRQLLTKLQNQVREISADIHRLAYSLHPSKLDHLGLAAAIKSLCAGFAESGKRRVEFQRNGFTASLPKEVELCLFRIAQEGLRNSIKHSDATLIEVKLEKTRTTVRLTVADNGCGFDTKSALMQRGLGFMSMKERLRLVGGEMRVHSHSRHGTRIEVVIPLARHPKSKQLTAAEHLLGAEQL